ncbi:efflux RND transporter periplasmic adaptor subunit [Nitrospirillum iridis]|uniref:Macrolide-specific efflux system membrane fusion protein n=1 Tax=Nitrospirillum iridis TaxID=765888 RepID=A0A7X0AVG9_9PROT|nr:efflux RND transporter periplasmic adaptor subunit [Nitrospirillum iridis]MBB6250853.1 macrolide-specific efflux system membrane fusion protein [Nitrospirillum iridis]
MKKSILIAGGVLALAGAGFAAKSFLFRPSPPAFMTAPVMVGDVEESILANGKLKPARLVAVGSQATGRVTALKVALGQRVAKGDLVATIDSTTQENNLKTEQAALASVRAQRDEKVAALTLAQQTLARQQAMTPLRAVSQADLQSAESDVAQYKAQIKSLDAQIVEAEVAVSTAAINLGYTQITAPIDGTVLSIVTQEGQTVNAAQSAPTIVILGQLDTMTVRTEISEADVVRVAPGRPVYFTILGDRDHRYDTTLTSIEPAPESITSDSSITSSSSTSSSSSSSSSSTAIYYNGLFNIPNPEGRLRTYMTAEVHIVLGQAKGVLTVPSSALAKGPDGAHMVRVMDSQGQITPRRVEIGLNNKVTAEVKSGLKQGERVVTGELSGDAKTNTSMMMGPPPGGGGGPPPGGGGGPGF